MKYLGLLVTLALVGILLSSSSLITQASADRFSGLSSLSPEKILKGLIKFPGSGGSFSSGDGLTIDRLRKPLKKLGQAAKKAFKRIYPYSEKKLRM